ncbi:phage protease [Aeromonas hydrophila]|uniref:phage protease n=1 Tax=Aeromonas hydrophila TaxID=644 RepID=UPI000690070F|nr:phage protease [Aeromonas hydrophila]
MQLFPVGKFKARDGRPFEPAGGHWVLDDAIAADLLANLAMRQTDIVFDYEHQTLYAEKNGKPAPAAGWLKPLLVEWRPGVGLFAISVDWTEAASAHIAAREYRYISPVFSYDRNTGAVLNLLHVALTNFPAIDGMEALIASATTKYMADEAPPKENTMNREQLIALLGLSADASDEDISTAMAAMKARGDTLAQEVAALKTEKTQLETAIAAAKTSAAPDPAKFVSVEVVEALKQDIAALRTESTTKNVDELVTAGLDDGRLLPAQEKWARDLGTSNIAALKGYLDSATPIAALKGRQTNHMKPPEKEEDLSPEALAICKSMGVDPKDYIKELNSKG